ncbi:MAG: hypothetical protein R2716_02275 [Microthrixaceae bacterium]
MNDYSDYGVEHRDVEDMLPAGVPYNVWVEEDLQVGDRVWPQTVRLVMNIENHVLDVNLRPTSRS